MRPEPDQLVPVREGVSLAAWVEGPDPSDTTATPFVLVHGLGSNAHLWDGVAAELAEAGHPSVRVDLRGHGRSSKPDGPYDVATVAEDLVYLVRAVGFGLPVVLAGQSYGAIVVMAAARTLGGAVASVACVDGGHIDLRDRFPDWQSCADLLSPPRLEGTAFATIESYFQGAHADWPEAGVAGALACFEVRDDGTVSPWLTFDRHIAVLRGLWEADTEAIRRATTHHTLLLTASDAPHNKRVDVDSAAAQLDDVEVVWMEGQHDLHAQHPEAVARLLLTLAPRP